MKHWRGIIEHLKEIKLNQFSPDGVSNIINATYNTRITDGNSGLILDSAVFTADDAISCVFKADSTYGDQQQVNVTGKFIPSDGTYTVTVRIEKISSIAPNLKSMSKQQQKQAMKQVFMQCDIRVACSCASFYWAGMSEDLAQVGGNADKFYGTKGKKVWRTIHQNSGGLKNSRIRICKHIKDVLDHIGQFTQDILSYL